MAMARQQRSGICILSRALALALLVGGASDLGATDFIRGDSNNDGLVSLADIHFSISALFRGGNRPECLNAGDVNDDGRWNIEDAVDLLEFLSMEGSPPRTPFPQPGPDPTVNPDSDLECQSYGNGSRLDDPAARIEVQGGFVPGEGDGGGTLEVRISNSTPIAGWSLRIRDEARVISEVGGSPPPSIQPPPQVYQVGLTDGSLTIAVLRSLNKRDFDPFPPGQVPPFRIPFCLQAGTPAGHYPLILDAGELVDDASGRSIAPSLGGSEISVFEDVEEGRCLLDSTADPPVRVLFQLADSTASTRDAVSVPFSIRSSRESQGFAFSVDFDEGVLQATSIRKLWTKPDGTPYEFEVFEIDNQDRTPGNVGVDEGFLVGAAIISLGDSASVIPPFQKVQVLDFQFRVRPGTPPGTTEIRFLDGGRGSGDPVQNKLITGGEVITPSLAGSFVFVNSRVNIVPDVTTFIRGDSNGDGKVDVSDFTASISHLFLGEAPPPCLDAADANDDGALNVADPITTLWYLFFEGGDLPPPHRTPGADPTPDALGCQVGAP